MNRRNFFRMTGGTIAAVLQEDGVERVRAASRYVKDRSPQEVAADEDYWAEIREAFTVDRNVTNLNNGYCSPSPRVVQEAMKRYLDYSNLGPLHTMIQVLEPQVENVRRRLAEVAGCDTEEIAITRNASEAMENAQYGLDLKRGDEVLTTNQDYPRMIATWQQRERREGIVLKMVSFPVPPPSMDYLAELFEKNITPRTKALLCCHITNRTGQIFPVKKIAQIAHAHNIPLLVDGAHAFAHFPFKISDLDCDYYGTSLHKWTLAPMGTGFLYVRKSRIRETWPLMSCWKEQEGNIRKFEEIGTHPAANHNAITEALAFTENIGIERKAARLRHLRDRWGNRLSQNPGVKLLHSPDNEQSCGIGFISFTRFDAKTMEKNLWDKYRILTVTIASDEYSGLRITPNIYTTVRDIDYFAEAVEKELKSA